MYLLTNNPTELPAVSRLLETGNASFLELLAEDIQIWKRYFKRQPFFNPIADDKIAIVKINDLAIAGCFQQHTYISFRSFNCIKMLLNFSPKTDYL